MIKHSDFVSSVSNMTRSEVVDQLGSPKVILDYIDKNGIERFMYEYHLPFDVFDSWLIVDIRDGRVSDLATLHGLDSDPRSMLDQRDPSNHD